jgi:hypothetical protein
MEAVAPSLSTPARGFDVFDRYLAEEAAIRLPDVDLADRARFHRVVRQCALAWSRHPKAAFHITRSRHALALSFDGPIEEKLLTLITFRSACEFGEYRFQGFNLTALPATLSPTARGNLQRLKELFEAALPQTFVTDGAVTVPVKKQPSIDFLPIIDEARRVLDEGNQDFPPVDLRELMVVPAEQARLYVGKTTVIPIVRQKVEPPAPKPVAGKPAVAPPAPPVAAKKPTAAAPPSATKPVAKPAAPAATSKNGHAVQNGHTEKKSDSASGAKSAKPAAKTAVAPAKSTPTPAPKPATTATAKVAPTATTKVAPTATAKVAPTAPAKAAHAATAKPAQKPVAKPAPKPAAKPVQKSAPKPAAKSVKPAASKSAKPKKK